MRPEGIQSQGKKQAFPQFLLAFMGICPEIAGFCPILDSFSPFVER
jgi:hypothetical protein